MSVSELDRAAQVLRTMLEIGGLRLRAAERVP